MKSLKWFVLLGSMIFVCHVGFTQQIKQTLTLKAGWNAIYLRVSPIVTAKELFGKWPVNSVSIYNASTYTNMQQFYERRTETVSAVSPFWTWSKELPDVNDETQLSGDSILVCFNNSGKSYTVTVQGMPVAPRIVWHSTKEDGAGLNYVAVSVQESARVEITDYFPGLALTPISRLLGTDEAKPTVTPLMFDSEYRVGDGQVYLYSCDETSDFSGVLNVSPQTGPDFGARGTTALLTIRNDGTTDRTVSVDYSAGVDECFFPELLYEDDLIALLPGWTTPTWPISRVIKPGATWTLKFGLDRRQFSHDQVIASCGGILTLTEDGPSKMLVQVPIKAESNPANISSYPAGLWVAQISLNKVDRILSDSKREEGLTAGGEMKFRVLLHVDENGKARLLQRVTLAGHTDQDGNTQVNLYAGGVTIPSAMETTYRISSVALPTDLPIIVATSGEFGDVAKAGREGGLRFDYLISSESPSNPFRHPFHPDHDGYDFDFKTKLPDGEDFENYNQTVKPELFPIAGTVIFQWNDDYGIKGWTPDATAKGTVHWGYGSDEKGKKGSLRHEGAIWASGTFEMKRISSDGNLIDWNEGSSK